MNFLKFMPQLEQLERQSQDCQIPHDDVISYQGMIIEIKKYQHNEHSNYV